MEHEPYALRTCIPELWHPQDEHQAPSTTIPTQSISVIDPKHIEQLIIPKILN